MILNAVIMGLFESKYPDFKHLQEEFYASYQDCSRLEIAPFFRAIHKLNCKAGIRETARRWLAVGRYVRENAWAAVFPPLIYYALDYLVLNAAYFLDFTMLFLKPATSFAVFDLIAALMTAIWFYAAWLAYWLGDRVWCRERSKKSLAEN